MQPRPLLYIHTIVTTSVIYTIKNKNSIVASTKQAAEFLIGSVRFGSSSDSSVLSAHSVKIIVYMYKRTKLQNKQHASVHLICAVLIPQQHSTTASRAMLLSNITFTAIGRRMPSHMPYRNVDVTLFDHIKKNLSLPTSITSRPRSLYTRAAFVCIVTSIVAKLLGGMPAGGLYL